MQSMTGFVSKTFSVEQENSSPLQLTINLKSLNSRFFETTFKMPSSLSALEIDVIKLLKKDLHRGHVYITINLHNPSAFVSNIEPALNTVEGYLSAIKKIKDTFNIHGEMDINHVTRLPQIFTLGEVQISDTSKKSVIDNIKTLIAGLVEVRTNEGTFLNKDLHERAANMGSLLIKIAEQSEHNIAKKKESVLEKVAALTAEIKDESLLENQKFNLNIGLDKLDIHEEITRFQGHLATINDILQSPKVDKGKSLDFALQECNREINTIAAKASCLPINTLAIEVKVEIEKARQQVQNII